MSDNLGSSELKRKLEMLYPRLRIKSSRTMWGKQMMLQWIHASLSEVTQYFTLDRGHSRFCFSFSDVVPSGDGLVENVQA